MGMFDVFHFEEEPLYCPYCGKKFIDIQSKETLSACLMYQVGKRLNKRDSYYNKSIVIKQDTYCLSEHPNIYLYIVIKDGVYLGVRSTISDAEELGDFDDERDYELIQ